MPPYIEIDLWPRGYKHRGRLRLEQVQAAVGGFAHHGGQAPADQHTDPQTAQWAAPPGVGGGGEGETNKNYLFSLLFM